MGCRRKGRGDDREHIRAQRFAHQGLADGVPGADAAGACVDGDAALYFVDDDGENLLLFLLIQDIALAVGAEGEDSMDAVFDHPVHLAAELLLVDGFILIHGGDDGNNDTF